MYALIEACVQFLFSLGYFSFLLICPSFRYHFERCICVHKLWAVSPLPESVEVLACVQQSKPKMEATQQGQHQKESEQQTCLCNFVSLLL